MRARKKIVALVSQDNETLFVELEIACISKTINSIASDFSFDYEKTIYIPLHNINTRTLIKVIEFCRHEFEISKRENFSNLKSLPIEEQTARQKNWKTGFFRISDSNLFQLTMAAAFLEIESLLDHSTKIIARKLSKKDIFQIKKNFNIGVNY
mmetsp:Transcript_61206/g.144068  ORF Transcript_61206/g.144068 Transcript_61206/m.144068 type:complete len:153 (+) Transcript_61206:481-939(+)